MPHQNLMANSELMSLKLIKSNDDMCHPNWYYIDILKFATCHLTHKLKIIFLFKIYE